MACSEGFGRRIEKNSAKLLCTGNGGKTVRGSGEGGLLIRAYASQRDIWFAGLLLAVLWKKMNDRVLLLPRSPLDAVKQLDS